MAEVQLDRVEAGLDGDAAPRAKSPMMRAMSSSVAALGEAHAMGLNCRDGRGRLRPCAAATGPAWPSWIAAAAPVGVDRLGEPREARARLGPHDRSRWAHPARPRDTAQYATVVIPTPPAARPRWKSISSSVTTWPLADPLEGRRLDEPVAQRDRAQPGGGEGIDRRGVAWGGGGHGRLPGRRTVIVARPAPTVVPPARRIAGRAVGEAAMANEVDAVVVGAGFAGLYLLHRLRGLGFRTVVLDAGRGRRGHLVLEPVPGGPLRRREHGVLVLVRRGPPAGVALDGALRRPGRDPRLRPPRGRALRPAPRHPLRDRVLGAEFDEATARWTVRTDGGDDGGIEVDGDDYSARFLIMATGTLSEVNAPAFGGLDPSPATPTTRPAGPRPASTSPASGSP